MRTIINHINTFTPTLNLALEPIKSWFSVREVNHVSELSDEYERVCHQHISANKWVMMVGADIHSLKKVSMDLVDRKKLLLLHSNKISVGLSDIEKALRSGNCSAVILCNSNYSEAQLSSLHESARVGNTQCILLNCTNQLH